MPHSDEDRAPVIIGVCAFLVVVALVATGLRIYARRLVRLSLWWDDWLCICGLPFAILPMIIYFVQIHNGFGKHEAALSDETLVDYFQYFYFLMLFYNVGLAFFKFSLLAFYIRVFSVIKTIRIASYIIGGLIFAWTLATEFILIFRCHPIEIAWTRTTEEQTDEQCISIYTVFITQAAPTIFFDMIILILPLRQIWALQLNTSQKIGIITVFALGFLVTIISILRLVEIFSTGTDFTYDFVNLGLLSAAEPVTGLLCCSLVTYGPFVQAFSRRFRESRQATDDSSSQRYLSQEMGYQRQRQRSSFGDEVQLNNFNSVVGSMTALPTVLQKDNAIHVKREYSVQRTASS